MRVYQFRHLGPMARVACVLFRAHALRRRVHPAPGGLSMPFVRVKFRAGKRLGGAFAQILSEPASFAGVFME